MRARIMVMLGLCCACHEEPSTSADVSVAQALDGQSAVLAKLCETADRCYPELQTSTACVFPAASGVQLLEDRKPPTCTRPLLDAHPKEAVAAIECVSARNELVVACAQDCPAGKTFEACTASTPEALWQAREACVEQLYAVITDEDRAALDACIWDME